MNSKQLSSILGTIIIFLLGVVIYQNLNTKPKEEILVQPNFNSQDSKLETNKTTQPLENKNTENSSNLPKGWKVYKNSKYQFSIGYPINWFVVDSSTGALTVSRIQSCAEDNSATLEQFMDKFRDCEKFTVWAGDKTPASFTDAADENYFKINIGGIEGQKFIYNLAAQGSVNGEAYYIPRATIDAQVKKNGIWYKFSMILHQQNINRAIKEFDEFLNSFKFE